MQAPAPIICRYLGLPELLSGFHVPVTFPPSSAFPATGFPAAAEVLHSPPPVLLRPLVSGLELERFIVCLHRLLVVAELDQGQAVVVPGLFELGIEVDGALEGLSGRLLRRWCLNHRIENR